jgi:hypothetical protein
MLKLMTALIVIKPVSFCGGGTCAGCRTFCVAGSRLRVFEWEFLC